jgi:hypothetical protein
VPTLIIILVAAGLIIAGVLVTGSKKNSNDAATGSTAGSATPVGIVKATAFDPPPGDGQENDADLGKTIDGDPNTLWQTSGYNNRELGGLKPGVGIAFTLDHATALDKLTIQSPTNDWSAKIYLSDGLHPDLAGWGDPVAGQDHIAMGTTTFDLGGHTGAAILVWITDLGDGGTDSAGRVHAQIAEVQVTAK